VPDSSPAEKRRYDQMWGESMMRVLADLGMPVQLVPPPGSTEDRPTMTPSGM
jgi:hypothetical protein